MRPQSEVRIDLAAALVEGGGTTRCLALRTGWSIGAVREALNNMARAQDARKRMVRVPGVKRPVPFYERSVRPADASAASAEPYRTLLDAWAGLAPAQPGAAAQQGAAM